MKKGKALGRRAFTHKKGALKADGQVNDEWRHFLQTDEWATVKQQSTSWNVHKLTHADTDNVKSRAPIYSYSRSVVGLGRVHYIPKVSKIDTKMVDGLTANLRKSVGGGLCIMLEVDQPYSDSLNKKLLSAGWLEVPGIQYDETVIIDLTPSEEEIRMSFKTRARWELSAAQRRGAVAERVECTPENMDVLFDMLSITAARGNFMIRKRKFHEKYWKHFADQGTGYLYFVKHEGDILSAAYVMKTGSRAFYKDGASIRLKSNLFASRLMHWKIMQDMKAEGATAYDMCGVMNVKHLDARNKGIHTFKTGFAPVVRLQGAYVLPLSKQRFEIWQKFQNHYVALYFKIMKDLWY